MSGRRRGQQIAAGQVAGLWATALAAVGNPDSSAALSVIARDPAPRTDGDGRAIQSRLCTP
jgi:hypothetical protein